MSCNYLVHFIITTQLAGYTYAIKLFHHNVHMIVRYARFCYNVVFILLQDISTSPNRNCYEPPQNYYSLKINGTACKITSNLGCSEQSLSDCNINVTLQHFSPSDDDNASADEETMEFASDDDATSMNTAPTDLDDQYNFSPDPDGGEPD